jgi:hypothetical protein
MRQNPFFDTTPSTVPKKFLPTYRKLIPKNAIVADFCWMSSDILITEYDGLSFVNPRIIKGDWYYDREFISEKNAIRLQSHLRNIVANFVRHHFIDLEYLHKLLDIKTDENHAWIYHNYVRRNN